MIRRLAAPAGLLLAVVIVAIVTIWWDPGLDWRKAPGLLLLNLLPVFLVGALVLGILRRPITTFLLVISLLAFIFYTNSVKLDALNQPLVFEDFLLVGQVLRGFELVGKYGSPVLFGAAVILGAVALVLALVFEKPVMPWPAGLTVFLVALVAFLSLGQQGYPLGSFYYGPTVTRQEWDPVKEVRLNGLLASVARASARPRFDHDALAVASLAAPAALEAHEPAVAGRPARTPDIFVVLNESFFDPGILDGVEDCELLPSWCAFREQGLSGRLEVPTYGGNTTRTEFELLTGIPRGTFDGLDYLYLTVVTQPVRSLAWLLQEQGYQTEALHNNPGYFWSRSTAMPRLGFERFRGLEDLGKRVEMGFFASDEMLDAPLAEFIDMEAEAPPVFLFVITMENHGPWNAHRRGRLPENVDDYVVPDAAAEIPAAPLQQYLFHADRSIAQFSALWERLRERERDTLMVFFGDHLPAMGPTFRAIGFDDGKAPELQRTPFLVLANFPLAGELPEEMPVHKFLLNVFDVAGVELDGRYADLHRVWTLENQAQSAPVDELARYREQLYFQLLAAPVTTTEPTAGRP